MGTASSEEEGDSLRPAPAEQVASPKTGKVQESEVTCSEVEDASLLSPKLRTVNMVGEPKRNAEPVYLDPVVAQKFMDLPQNGKVQAMYVWLDSSYTSSSGGFDLCNKARTLTEVPHSVSDLPVWAYSGADGTDVQLKPQRIYGDPFHREGDNILVLCDTYEEPEVELGPDQALRPTEFNTRVDCEEAMRDPKVVAEEPWFGLEQEYYLLDLKTRWPLGWPNGGFPGKHDEYYCATGADMAIGRDVAEAHYQACLNAGVEIGGINSEVAPAQWEYQVGPRTGVAVADDLWMSRYILQRVCATFNVGVTFVPKPVEGWPGLGCHTNYSTASTRAPLGGKEAIFQHCRKLQYRHFDHTVLYGKGNERRLSGKHDTPSFRDFSVGIGARSASIRIGARVAANGYGYYEDRRPAANMDPYQVTRLLVETTILDAKPVKPCGKLVLKGKSIGVLFVALVLRPGYGLERPRARSQMRHAAYRVGAQEAPHTAWQIAGKTALCGRAFPWGARRSAWAGLAQRTSLRSRRRGGAVLL